MAVKVHQEIKINTRTLMQITACVFVILMQLVAMGKPITCQHTTVVLYNSLPAEMMQVHCLSKDNDLGWHTIAYLATYSFDFNVNLWGRTLFACDITSDHHPISAHVVVYRGPAYGVTECNDNCDWSITPNGFYLNGKFMMPWPSNMNTNVSTRASIPLCFVLGSFWDLFPFLSFPFSLFCFWVCEGGCNFINPK